MVNTLRHLAIDNCRLIYGWDRSKFYGRFGAWTFGSALDMRADVILCEDEENGVSGALLTCNQNGHTKILRNEVNHCPVQATRDLVQRLQRDTAVVCGIVFLQEAIVQC